MNISPPHKSLAQDCSESEFRATLANYGFDRIRLLRFRYRQLVDIPWDDFLPFTRSQLGKRANVADPLSILALDRDSPCLWKDAPACGLKQIIDWPGLSRSKHFDGMTFPIHGRLSTCDILHVCRSLGDSPAVTENDIWVMFSAAIIACLRLKVKQPLPSARLPVDFSDRERTILGLCRDGKSYAEMGDILGISSKTAEFHMCNVMRKLDTNRKVLAIVAAIKLGLIDA